jgi:DNA-binding PadR family transcriptional regulator
VSAQRRLGRYVEPAMLILVALHGGPHHVVRLFDRVRSLNGPVGHGSLFAALSRLETLDLVEAVPGGDGRRAYRLTGLGLTASASVAAIRSEGHA